MKIRLAKKIMKHKCTFLDLEEKYKKKGYNVKWLLAMASYDKRKRCRNASYTGEISAVFYHVMPNMPRYKVGDKIVQFHLETSDNIMFVETDELNKTERGDNGYGSSDKK